MKYEHCLSPIKFRLNYIFITVKVLVIINTEQYPIRKLCHPSITHVALFSVRVKLQFTSSDTIRGFEFRYLYGTEFNLLINYYAVLYCA